MAGFNLDARARLSIELALTAGRGDPIFARQQEIDAKAVILRGLKSIWPARARASISGFPRR